MKIRKKVEEKVRWTMFCIAPTRPENPPAPLQQPWSRFGLLYLVFVWGITGLILTEVEVLFRLARKLTRGPV